MKRIFTGKTRYLGIGVHVYFDPRCGFDYFRSNSGRRYLSIGILTIAF